MNKRSVDILQTLMGNKTLINQLAERYGVSVRTIRNDINTINEFLENNSFAIIDIDRQGLCSCFVELSKVKGLLKQNDFYNYKLSKDERRFMISKMLMFAHDFITLGAMADRLQVSRATVVNDMENVKEHLEKYRISVISHPNKGFKIGGAESAKRIMLWHECNLNKEMLHEQVVESSMDGVHEQQLNVIRKIIHEQEHAHGLSLTDESYESLVNYIWIVLKRTNEGIFVENCDDSKTIYDSMARDILKYVGQYCRLTVTESEELFLGSVLKSLRYIARKKMDKKILSIQIVTRQFLSAISKDLGSDLNKDYYLFENLSSHLAMSLEVDSSMFSKDSMFFEITREYPDIYQVVHRNQQILEAYIGRKLAEIESVYIIIHICAALERKKSSKSLKVILVCSGGVGTSQLLAAKLENQFDFQIEKAISSHEAVYLTATDADLLISTVPLGSMPIPSVEISVMMEIKDCQLVRQAEEKVRAAKNPLPEPEGLPSASGKELKKRIDTLIGRFQLDSPEVLSKAIFDEVTALFERKDKKSVLKLRNFLTEDFIELDVECRIWQEAVVKSAERLLVRGYIEKRYVDAMIRGIELNGPYIIISPGFACPHAGLDEGTKKTGMSLIRLKRPVKFGNGISAKFFCCLSAVDNETHLPAFINLVNLLENEEFNMKLSRAESAFEAARIIADFEYALKYTTI
ncbi:BglG family transcription antiterminator [Lacrimispora sp.]|uniref:BglG family transcription antiterminator n=1 Tax=Lacrimispora sp. TaxID=2719234 RepID=UPI0028A99B3F|nr:PTS sugar transporter subunit IIA [Lacrimispora sp.]